MVEYRAAVHEAGHAVCIWFSPYARGLTRITIDDGSMGEGRVAYTYSGSRKPEALWYQVVGHLGGIAGEMHEFGRLRSGGSAVDLVNAKKRAMEIVESDKLLPPWGAMELPEGHFDMAGMYRSIDKGSAVALVLNLAYQRARYLVDADHERLVKVAEALAEYGVLEELDIRRIFGKRPAIRWFG
jgi:ATP-dependent Zn protease